MKKTGRLGPARQSMAPQPLSTRTSNHALNVSGQQELAQSVSSAVPGSRRSLMPRNDKDLLLSGSRGDAGIYGRTPQTARRVLAPGSTRRSSVFPSGSQGRTSLAPGYHSVLYKDPRPIRDKTFQANCSQNLNQYLVSARYPGLLNSKTFVSPTAKDFQTIFRFLVNDCINLGVAWGKKFEDDTISVLKDLKYPALDTVGKTALTAPGTPQAWPYLLAMLSWLVDLCKSIDNWDDPDVILDPMTMPAAELSPEYPNYEHRLLWDFAAKTYAQWFDGEVEEFGEAELELEQAYERMAAATIEESDKMAMEVQRRTAEVQRLEAQEPPLKKLEDEYVQLIGDNTKFLSFLDLHRQKADKVRQRIVKVKELVAQQAQELQSHERDLADIERRVAAQNLSPDEANRMTIEKDTLARSLDDLRNKIAEASQFAYDQEMMVTKSMDRFETLLADYNSNIHQLGLLDSSSGLPALSTINVDYVIDLDLGAEDLDDVKSVGQRMRTTIWQALQTCRELYRQEALTFGNSAIALDDEFDKLGQIVERRKEEAGSLEARIKNVHQQANDTHSQLMGENAETSRIITQLETEVTSMLASSQQGVLFTQSQLESTKIAFQELRHKTALLQDSVVAQIGEQIDLLIKTKEHTANSLKSIRALAETQ